jgi:excisionase family DNA binding protein
MWGSNFPSSRAGGYSGQVQLGQTALSWLSDDDRLYTIAEVAERLGMSPYAIMAWVKAGRLKACRIGRFWRTRARDLERFIDDPPPLHPDRPAAP